MAFRDVSGKGIGPDRRYVGEPVYWAALLLLASAAKTTVAIDPGHGTRRNTGAQTVLCESEASVMLAISKRVANHLDREKDIDVHLLRTSDEGPKYRTRIRRAAEADADVLLSFHGDYRGEPETWKPNKKQTCERHPAETGFAVLYSDFGPKDAVRSRRRLARAIAREMRAAGFEAYSGADYGSQYEKDGARGVFKDRRGLFMLRRPKMPSVIIETHHLLNLEEHRRWSDVKTQDEFASALERALRSLRKSR